LSHKIRYQLLKEDMLQEVTKWAITFYTEVLGIIHTIYGQADELVVGHDIRLYLCLVKDYHSTLRYTPEERRSQW
jgi:hypothetical protein